MAGHLECIGIATEEELVRTVERAVGTVDAERRADGTVELVWRDAEGASLAVNLGPDGEVLCARPSFAASSWLDVRLNGFADDPQCPFCSRVLVDVLDDEGDAVYPLALELENIAEIRGRGAEGQAQASMTAFAESVEHWPDESAYYAAQTAQPSFAAMSFVPTGLFVEPPRRRFSRRAAEPPPAAHGLLTGVVREAAVPTNSVTGRRFAWASVETYGGVYALVASIVDAPEGFRPAEVVQSSCWLIARVQVDGSDREASSLEVRSALPVARGSFEGGSVR